ncbi:MAG: hypothetical protein FJX77_15360 [Armatimonadetes bacterium]|nr:hypothetical protein [Armatimonadota bacterium]
MEHALGPIERLTRTGHPRQTPRVSPDGKLVVFTRIAGAYLSLRRIGPEGGEELPLFPGRDDFIQQHPCWTRDGRSLAFTVNQGLRNGQLAVHACDREGESFTRFRAIVPGGQNCHPAWSPDGRQLAYVALSSQLSLVNADGSGARRLGSLAGQQFFPSWSPDGRWILFTSSHEGAYQLYRMHPDGSGLDRLSQGEGLDTHPVWSPDGKRIAFASNRTGSYDLYTMDPGGGRVIRHTSGDARDDYPGWSPDGRSLYFVSTRDGSFDLYRTALQSPGT